MIRNLVSVLIAMFLCLPAYAEKENKSDKTEETTAKESVETEVDENEDLETYIQGEAGVMADAGAAFDRQNEETGAEATGHSEDYAEQAEAAYA